MNQPISGTVEIPRDYFFTMATKDYRDWQKALWREFFQNSIDAGATEIKVATDIKTGKVTISDNGTGMTLDILQNKLFCLGGTEKASGSVGAFGKAKELLFFSWPNYRIKTKSLDVTGEHNEYTIKESEKNVNGTRCTIELSEQSLESTTIETLISHGKFVAGLMETPCNISFDGHPVETTWHRGSFVRDLGWCQIFHTKDDTDARSLQVRINGVWMFSKFIGSDIGAVTIEITKNSLECLTSNRDGLQERYQTELDEFLKRLIADTTQALKPEKQIIRRKYEGTGVIELAAAREALDESLQNVVRYDAGAINDSIRDLSKEMIARLNLEGHESTLLEHRLAQIGAAAKNSDYAEDWSYDYKDRMALIGYRPDFVTKCESQDDAKCKKFMRSRKANVLALMWTEVVKEVLLSSGNFVSFTCGFTLESDVEAQIEQLDGTYYFYLNPELVLNGTPYQKAIFKKRRILVEDLKDKAIHEISHIRYEYHDEGFVAQMARIRLTTYDSYFAYQTIQNIK